MKKHLQIIATLVVLISCQTAPQKNANHPTNQRQVAGELDNEAVWGKYCKTPNGGGANSTEIPEPNYANPEVDALVKNFQSISLNSFYLYPAIVRVYGLKKATNQTEMAHNFLIYLCGEFRDRATMVEAKIKWFGKFNKLAPIKQGKVDPKKDIWMQMTAKSYQKFISFSADLWNARRISMETVGQNKVDIGKHIGVDLPVPGMNVCEVKYIFNNYVISNNELYTKEEKIALYDYGSGGNPSPVPTALARFKQGLETYQKNNCDSNELVDYYDFRGDSNYKPNSPESNGMIWYTLMMANSCQSPTKAFETQKLQDGSKVPNKITNADCENYFRNPFQSRWNAAKAGLSTWMLRDIQHDEKFADDGGQPLVLVPRLMNGVEAHKPFSFRFDMDITTEPMREDFMLKSNLAQFFSQADLGFTSAIQTVSEKTPAELTYERLRDAVNRHTNWYQSGWDDGLGTDRSIKTQAYSPFVASSYEPHESDAFTACGITVSCPPDGYKHWMFVFRIKGDNWYTSADAAKGKPLDFDHMWFDETSLGTTGLAKSEKAWDRLGTAFEEELTGGAILYLHHITTDGKIVPDDTLPPEELNKEPAPSDKANIIAKREIMSSQGTTSCKISNDVNGYWLSYLDETGYGTHVKIAKQSIGFSFKALSQFKFDQSNTISEIAKQFYQQNKKSGKDVGLRRYFLGDAVKVSESINEKKQRIVTFTQNRSKSNQLVDYLNAICDKPYWSWGNDNAVGLSLKIDPSMI